MKTPAGVFCDVCGEEIATIPGQRLTEFRVDGIEDTLHAHGSARIGSLRCVEVLQRAQASGHLADLPPSSPLRKFFEGDPDPFREQRERSKRGN